MGPGIRCCSRFRDYILSSKSVHLRSDPMESGHLHRISYIHTADNFFSESAPDVVGNSGYC